MSPTLRPRYRLYGEAWKREWAQDGMNPLTLALAEPEMSDAVDVLFMEMAQERTLTFPGRSGGNSINTIHLCCIPCTE